MPSDHNRRDGEIHNSDLDTALAAASSELLAYVLTQADPATALLAIMAASETPPPDPAGHAELHVSPASRIDGDEVLAAIKMRALARPLARALNVALAHARALARDLTFCRDLARDLALDVALDHDLDLDLDRARDLAVGLDVALNLELALHVARDRDAARDVARDLASDVSLDRARARARAVALAHARARDRVRALDVARDLARDLDRYFSGARPLASQLNEALDHLLETVRRLAPSEINAEGADLSRGDFRDLTMLEGVTWTPETIWPPGLADQMYLISEKIADNVYRVRGGTQQDQASLTNI